MAHGDLVDRVTEATIGLNNSHGPNPAFKWLRGDSCSVVDDASGIVMFDVGNCTSSIDSEGILTVNMPMKVNWTWDDERKMEAVVSMNDDLGPQVNAWTTDTLSLNVENDIQLDGMRVWEETGRELYPEIGSEEDSISQLVGESISKVLHSLLWQVSLICVS